MRRIFLKKILTAIGVGVFIWLGIRYLLPVGLPFLLGLGIALLAEPTTRTLGKGMPRWGAAAISVSLTLGVLAGVTGLAGVLVVRQVGRLAKGLPEMAQTARQGLTVTRDWLLTIGEKTPESIRPIMRQTVTNLFGDSSIVLEQATQRLPGMVTMAIGRVGNGVVTVGTGILSAFLISARLPQLKNALHTRLPDQWKSSWLPALQRVKTALGGWLKAQLKLCAVTWGIVSVGFLLLRIPQGAIWALVVAIVDAVPVLGTGTILVPWAVVCLIKKESLKAIGLLCTYGAAAMTRTVLEPRLMGKQLGLDPLTTLIALYAGYRFWGFTGLLLTPILASAAKSILQKPPEVGEV